MSVAWALIIVLANSPTVQSYFANHDMCEAARVRIEKDLAHVYDVKVLSSACHLVGMEK